MKFIAHRGYSARYEQNTLPAFQAVLDHPRNGRSIIGVELDIQFTADLRIAVFHDTTVKGEDGADIAVADMNFSGLQRFFKHRHKDEALSVPDIDQVLDLVSHRTELHIHVKEEGRDLDGLAGLLARSLERYRPAGDIVVSSFSCEVLRTVIGATSHLEMKFGLLCRELKDLQDVPLDVYRKLHFLHPKHKLVLHNPKELFGLGLPLHVWTVKKPNGVQSILDLPDSDKVRAIITDDIALSEQFGES